MRKSQPTPNIHLYCSCVWIAASQCRPNTICLSNPLPQHLSYGNGSLHVDAAFQQTLWSVAPICSGSEVGQGKPVCQSLCFSLCPSVYISSYLSCFALLLCTCLSTLAFPATVLIYCLSCLVPVFFCSPAPLLAGFLIGGDVLRLLHGHMDECLTVPSGEHGDEQRR